MHDILTENEAKKRWCPLGRLPDQQGDLFVANRHPDGGPSIKCIGSECMAWRCAHKPASNGDETGYCGAFGLPRFT